MSCYVPKSVKGKNLPYDDVSAYFSTEPLDCQDEHYDFKRHVENMLIKYAEVNTDWRSPQSRYDGKCKLRKMIHNEELRMNKARTGYLSVWVEFDKWRKKQIIHHCNMSDEEKQKRKAELNKKDPLEDKKTIKTLRNTCSKYRKRISDLETENLHLKLAMYKMENVEEYIDPETGEMNPNFIYDEVMTPHLTPMDYSSTDEDPYDILVAVSKEVQKELFNAFQRKPTKEYRKEIIKLFGDWLEAEFDIIPEDISDEFEEDYDDIDNDFQVLIDAFYDKVRESHH